jgi:nucleoside-triphosphatase
MSSQQKNLLITGIPGVGKTTLIKKILTQLDHLKTAGFYTQEVRETGVRKGFELVDLRGQRSLLSHIRIKSPYFVGKYGVDVVGFNKFLDTVDFLNPQTDLIVIDEIGKMECYSEKFTSLLRKILNSELKLIATVSRKGGGLIAEIKERNDIHLYELTMGNRDRLAVEIVRAIAD